MKLGKSLQTLNDSTLRNYCLNNLLKLCWKVFAVSSKFTELSLATKFYPTVTSHVPFFFSYLSIYLSIYLWLRWVFVAVHRLFSSCGEGGYSSLRCVDFSLQWLLLLWSTGSRRAGSVIVACGLSSCGSRAQQLWRMGFIAPRHLGSSRTRDQTRVPCIGGRILNHCATREVPIFF